MVKRFLHQNIKHFVMKLTLSKNQFLNLIKKANYLSMNFVIKLKWISLIHVMIQEKQHLWGLTNHHLRIVHL